MRQPRVPAPPRHDPAHGRKLGPVKLLGFAGLGFALLLLAGPIACASSSPAAAHRNNAERPPPFAYAPDVTVPDATGTPRDLASLMGPKGLVLVLYRGHW